MTEHQLFLELKSARQAARQAAVDAAEAKYTWLSRRDALRKAQGLVEEILEEIETGKSRYPVMDAIDGQGGEGAPPETVTEGIEKAARSGFDLVTSRPDSRPETNDVPAPSREATEASTSGSKRPATRRARKS